VGEEQVAAVYARALFDAAGQAGVVEPVREDLDAFAGALGASATLRDVLSDPQVDTAAKRRVIAELTRDGQALVRNTLLLLVDRGRFALTEELTKAYDKLAARDADRIEVEVTSAVTLTEDDRKKIAARVAGSTGRTVELAERVDPSILGGLVLRVGDVIVDGSVQARIRQLRRKLATAELRGDVE
jgi:F-type H+-transporting ATPase subunit delta